MNFNLVNKTSMKNNGFVFSELDDHFLGLKKKSILMLLSVFMVVFVMVVLLPAADKKHQNKEGIRKVLTRIPEIINTKPTVKKTKRDASKKNKQKKTQHTDNQPGKKINAYQAASRGAKELGQGNMPALIGTIEMPFKTYLGYTQKIGGVLAIFDRQTNRVVGRISRNQFIANTTLSGYARRTRDITTDMPARLKKEYLNKVIQARGKGVYRFLILLPEKREQQFVGTLSLLLDQKGVALHSADEVIYRYRLNNGRINLQVQQARVKGQIININLTSQI